MTDIETHGEYEDRQARLAAESTEGTLEVPNRWIPSPALRSWLYGVSIAVLALCGALEIVSPQLNGAITGVVAAVLGIANGSLALANTPK